MVDGGGERRDGRYCSEERKKGYCDNKVPDRVAEMETELRIKEYLGLVYFVFVTLNTI